MRGPTRLLATLAALSSTACLNLDDQNQVKDLRILAVRLDPPEMLFSFLHLFPPEQRGGFPLGPYPMTVQALVVDPEGREVDLSVRLCPEDQQLDKGCEGYVMRATAPADQNAAIGQLLHPVKVERKADLSLGGEVSVPSIPMAFPDVAVDYMLPHSTTGALDLGGTLVAPTLPSVVLKAQVKDGPEYEVAFKRFSLALDISPQGVPDQLRQAVQDVFRQGFGVEFCPDGTDPLAEVQCVKNRRANRNPSLQRILYKMGNDITETDDPNDVTSGGQFQDLVGRPVVKPGDSVRIRPVLADGDMEPYQAFSYDVGSGKLVLQNYTEDPAFSWFTTVGKTCGQSTASVFFKTPDCEWSVSQDAKDGPAHVWVIARDQRGGVDWRRLDFEVRTEAAKGGGFGLSF